VTAETEREKEEATRIFNLLASGIFAVSKSLTQQDFQVVMFIFQHPFL